MATTTRPTAGDERADPGRPGGGPAATNGKPPAPADRRPDTDRDRSSSAPGAATTVGASAGARHAAPLPDVEPRRRGRRRRFLLLVPVLVGALAAATLFGYRYWYESTYFVVTDNAQITGDLVQLGSLNAGRIVATRVEVGASVRAGQEIAVVAMPQQVASGSVGAAPRMDVLPTTDALVSVQSTIDGLVAARTGHVGATVAAGQPIYTLVDPRRTWIKANVEEGKLWMIRPGQPVQIHVDALNRDVTGRVESITPASAATFSLLPTGNVSGNFVKVTQYVPIKIVPDETSTFLPLGTSVVVRIRVREHGEELPLPWRP